MLYNNIQFLILFLYLPAQNNFIINETNNLVKLIKMKRILLII